jgi:hypothetical protein
LNPRALVIKPVESIRILVGEPAYLKADSLSRKEMGLVQVAILFIISSPVTGCLFTVQRSLFLQLIAAGVTGSVSVARQV